MSTTTTTAEAPCRYCGCLKDCHDVANPATDAWHYCHGCGQSHVYRPQEAEVKDHPEGCGCFGCYLSQPCEEPGCDAIATHNAQPGGAVCNAHIPEGGYVRARND